MGHDKKYEFFCLDVIYRLCFSSCRMSFSSDSASEHLFLVVIPFVAVINNQRFLGFLGRWQGVRVYKVYDFSAFRFWYAEETCWAWI